MSAIFSKNCILTGDLDLYCLVCSTHLPGEEDVLAHIQDSKHNASLRPITYHEKFKDDFIRKVNGIYYCEVCNKTFSTAAKVGIHVAEETHIKGKRRQLTRVGTSIVFQKKFLIEESAWNGLVEDTCLICNAEFDDYLTHISDQNHVLNVIRSRVTIDNNNNIYRKVEGGCHCLTCNKIVSDNSIMAHLNSTEHENAAIKYDHGPNSVSNEIDAAENVENNKTKKETNSNVMKEDVDTKSLTSEKCCSTDGKSSNSGTVLMKDKEKPVSSKSTTKEVETFAKQHGLSVDKYNYTVYCNVCSVQVPATLNCVKEHVTGKKHKDNSQKHSFAIQNNIKKNKKVNLKDFFTKIDKVTTTDGTYFLINDKFLLTSGDFYGLLIFGSKVVCEFCHIDLNLDNVGIHIKTALHRNIMDNSFVITSLENEFVRQIKSDLYHCGYCGKVESDFDDMLDHLATAQHKLRRAESEEMLRRIKIEEFILHRFIEVALASM